MIKEYLINRARKKAIERLIKEVRAYQVKISAADSETFLNIFNTGLMLNVRTAGTKLLDIAAAVLKKEVEKRKNEYKNPTNFDKT